MILCGPASLLHRRGCWSEPSRSFAVYKIVDRNQTVFSIPSVLALMLAKPTLMSLAQWGIRPQRIKHASTSPVIDMGKGRVFGTRPTKPKWDA
jgi:hypothetical protein